MTAVVRSGMRTPWGTADWVQVLGEGIGVVDTASHGGVKLDAARNRRVPAPLRRPGGWYEEDCDAAIPMYFFPEAFPGTQQRDVLAVMVRWYPDQVTAAGITHAD